MTNFQTLRTRILAATTIEQLDRVETSATRVYNTGQLSPAELRTIDLAIVDKRIAIEQAESSQQFKRYSVVTLKGAATISAASETDAIVAASNDLGVSISGILSIKLIDDF